MEVTEKTFYRVDYFTQMYLRLQRFWNFVFGMCGMHKLELDKENNFSGLLHMVHTLHLREYRHFKVFYCFWDFRFLFCMKFFWVDLIILLFVGPLVRQVIRHMMEKRDGTMKPDYKMTMYSAHDTTVANFLMALGIFDEQSPPYRSLVLVELWKNDQAEYQVKVRIIEMVLHFSGKAGELQHKEVLQTYWWNIKIIPMVFPVVSPILLLWS